MKQKRKQELQTNELAQMLSDSREFFARYGNYLLGGVAVLVIIVALFIWMHNAQAAERQRHFELIREARFMDDQQEILADEKITATIESLRQVARETDDPTLAQQAWIQLSKGVLALCLRDPVLASEPDRMRIQSRETHLQAAEDACKKLLERFGQNAVTAGNALLDLAKIEENRFVLDGDPSRKEKAREYLERITRNENGLFTATPFMERALEAINELDNIFTQVTFAPPEPEGPTPEAEPVIEADEDPGTTGLNAASPDPEAGEPAE